MYAKMSKKDRIVKRRSHKLASIKDHPNVIEAALRLSSLIESVKCSICLEVMIRPARIKCGHTFCTLCIENAIQFNKAGEGTELRKFSGGGAKANCPLCKAANINKRSITYDPLLEEKIKIIKQLQENIKHAAKELGFELSSIKLSSLKNGTIEGRTGFTPKKTAVEVNKPCRSSIETKSKNQKTNPEVDNALLESFIAASTLAPKTKAPKMYGSSKTKSTERTSNIAKHFKITKVPDIYENVYDELTFETPPISARGDHNHDVKEVSSEESENEICMNKNASSKRSKNEKHETPNENLDDSSMSLTLHSISPRSRKLSLKTDKEHAQPCISSEEIGIKDQPLQSLDHSNLNIDSNSSLALHTISPRPKRLKLAPKSEDKENEGILNLVNDLNGSNQKDDKNSSSSLSLNFNNARLSSTKKSSSSNEDISKESNTNKDSTLIKKRPAKKNVPKQNLKNKKAIQKSDPIVKSVEHLSSSSSLSLHSVENTKNELIIDKEGKSFINEPASLKKKENEDTKYHSPLRIEKQIKQVLKTNKSRSIPFIIKGSNWSSSVFGTKKKTNVVFLKMGNLAPNEKLNLSVTNMSDHNLTLTMKGRKHSSTIEQDPDKSGIVLETETSTSTQNTQENLKILNHQTLLDIENEKPTVDDFDMTEDEVIAMTKDDNFPIKETGYLPLHKEVPDDDLKEAKPVSMNNENEPIDDLEEFVNMDDPFSIDESDDDMFEATPEATFQPLNTSTTKSKQKILSQGPIVSLKWKDIIQRNVENDLFESFEIALHGDFGEGIKSGELYPSKPELWQLLTGCGATVYKSVNLFTFARGVTGLCIVNDTMGRDSGSKQGSRVNDYNRIFACSDVAVIEKEWLLKCFSQNKLVSILPYLLHRATEEELRRLDYGELL